MTTTIALIAAIIGLIGGVLGLILQAKKIKRENFAEKKRLQKEVYEAIEEKKKAEELNKIIVSSVDDYLEEKLPHLISNMIKTEKPDFTAKSNEIRKDLKDFLVDELSRRIEKTSTNKETAKKEKKRIEKTLAEAYGINESNLRDGFGFVDNSKY